MWRGLDKQDEGGGYNLIPEEGLSGTPK